MENKEAKQLLDKYLAGTCTPEELAIIKRAYNKEIPEDISSITDQRYADMKTNIWQRIEESMAKKVSLVRLWPRIAVAAALVLIAGASIYIFIGNPLKQPISSIYANDVEPGGNRATLTLANGKSIHLSDAKSGVIIKANELLYDDGSNVENFIAEESGMAMITTPRGGNYRIQLADGTIVALNAESTLKFPSSFSKTIKRRVELSGEAYFEVAKDKNHPFIVASKDQEVTVLGTHFNVNSYLEGTGTKTTLAEGSVSVRTLVGGDSKKILPGQQAMLNGARINVSEADMEVELAWKNGDFSFNTDLKTIMRQISRWYDVEIVYEGNVTGKEFLGTVSRSKKITEILKSLELTKRVHFKVEGRRVTVMP
ncbi:MAG: FecR domain-containing protein [Bacteroidota bacterium]